MIRRVSLLASLAAIICFTGGCASSNAERNENNYSRFAEEAYNDAVKSLEEGHYKEAGDAFKHVANKFPLSKFATLAELKMADCDFEREAYIEAADSYRVFVRLHPNHQYAPYAMFRTGLSHYKQIPDEWFILPPAREHDPTEARNAVEAYREFLRRFPNHVLAAEARSKIVEARLRLAEHELYVAGFYRKEGKPKAVAGRLEGLKRDYGDLPILEEVLYGLVWAHRELNEPDKERAVLDEIIARFPNSKRRAEAQRRRAELIPVPGKAPKPNG